MSANRNLSDYKLTISMNSRSALFNEVRVCGYGIIAKEIKGEINGTGKSRSTE